MQCNYLCSSGTFAISRPTLYIHSSPTHPCIRILHVGFNSYDHAYIISGLNTSLIAITSVLELALLLIIVTTHSLDFFTRLLLSPPFDPSTGGTPSYIFLAPSSWSTAFRSIELVDSTDDFTVAIVKMAMACLDATNFVGLANEVAHINADGALAPNNRSQRAEDNYDIDEDSSTVRLGPTGVAWTSTSHLSRRRNAIVGNREIGRAHV